MVSKIFKKLNFYYCEVIFLLLSLVFLILTSKPVKIGSPAWQESETALQQASAHGLSIVSAQRIDTESTLDFLFEELFINGNFIKFAEESLDLSFQAQNLDQAKKYWIWSHKTISFIVSYVENLPRVKFYFGKLYFQKFILWQDANDLVESEKYFKQAGFAEKFSLTSQFWLTRIQKKQGRSAMAQREYVDILERLNSANQLTDAEIFIKDTVEKCIIEIGGPEC